MTSTAPFAKVGIAAAWVALGALGSPTGAQTASPVQPNVAPAAIPDAPAPPRLTLEEATAKATEMLDRFDARWGETPSREELQELEALLAAIQRGDPKDPRVDYLYGRAFAAMGRGGSARNALVRFVETREGRNEWKAFRILGDLFVDEFPRMALAKYQKAAELKPDDPTVLLGMSRAHYEVGELNRALELARRTVEADSSGRLQPLTHLANMFAAAEQWPDAERTALRAIATARELVRSEPPRKSVLIALQQQYDLLVNILQSNLTGGPPQPDTVARLGRAMRERAEVAEQVGLVESATFMEAAMRVLGADATPEVHLEYGLVLAQLGRIDDAILAFQKVLVVQPDHAEAQSWIARLQSSAAGTTRP